MRAQVLPGKIGDSVPVRISGVVIDSIITQANVSGSGIEVVVSFSFPESKTETHSQLAALVGHFND